MKYKKRLTNNIANQCKVLYEQINKEDMTLGKIKYNERSHLNAVQAVVAGIATKVILTVAINEDNCPIVHFINVNKDNKFVDHSWGWTYKEYKYYYVREIKEHEFDDIGTILDEMKRFLINNNSNSFLRKIHRIHLDII